MSRRTISAASAMSLAVLAGACAQTPLTPDAAASPSPIAVQVPPLKPPPEPTMTVITVTKDGPALEAEVLTSERLDVRLRELAAAPEKLPVLVTPGDPDVSAEAVEKVRERVRAAGLELAARVGEARPARLDVRVGADGALRLNDEPIAFEDLRVRLRAAAASENPPEVNVFGASGAKYSHVAPVLAEAQALGLVKLGVRAPTEN